MIDQKTKALEIREKILALTREYTRLTHSSCLPGGAEGRPPFVAGETVVPYAGRVFDDDEVVAAVRSSLDFWLTLGPEGDRFERELAGFLGVRRTLLVNSGSSANLVAVSALTTPKLPRERRLCRGDEVITVAAGFPTTVAPIVQCGAVPVFVDADPTTGNARADMLEDALTPGRTKAVMMAHALGNPFDLASVTEFCRRHDLWLIEDNCDALGSAYAYQVGQPDERSGLTGQWGDLSTQSFYPPHHLTLGEGGAVNVVSDMRLKLYVESFRDWGRDCWCPSGRDNTCNKRFGWKMGELPEGYDHKYIYSHLGYNLKPLDLQAAIGIAQLAKLPDFVAARKTNWSYLRRGLAEFEDVFEFSLPTHATAWSPEGFRWDESGNRADCSWFGFMMLVRESAPFSRTALARALDAAKIGNRMLFGGNLVRQPAFINLLQDVPDAFRTVGNLDGADRIMNEAIFVGTYPGLSEEMMEHIIATVAGFVREHGARA